MVLARPSARTLLWSVPYLALFVSLFWPTLGWMADRFSTHDSFYSHGWLIPFASAWLIWQRRERLRRTAWHASHAGLLLLVPSLLVHAAASWLDLHFVSGFAMVGAVWGLVWTVWGWRVLHALRFPMLFLLFMVPLPGVLLIFTSFHMKLFAATLATHAVNLIGFPAVQAGSTIHLANMSVVVDDTCSGLRSLISLIALATLWTSLMPAQSRGWHKVALVASSIPIALVANMARIMALIVLSTIYGPSVADGFIHYGSGVVVFGVALILLAWLSKRLVPSGA